MSTKTRYFVLTAGAILAIGLTTGLVASYMGLPVAFSRAAGPNELQYIPADAAIVAYADVRNIMDSEFRQRFRQFEPDTHDRDEFQQKTGVNIEQDIDTVVAALMPGPADSTGFDPEKRFLILARGRFQQSHLEALALEHGGKAEDYQGKRLLMHVNENGEPEMAVGFLEGDLIGLGSYAAIKSAIDASQGKNVVSNTELMRQINDLENSNAWAVGRLDAVMQGSNLPGEIQAQLPAIQWFSAATQINGGVSGVVKAEARDEASGQNLRDVVRGFLALVKIQAGSKPEMQSVVDSLQLSGEGKNVALSFSLPSELFDLLESMAKEHHQQLAPKQ